MENTSNEKVIVSIKDGVVIDVIAPALVDVIVRDYNVAGFDDTARLKTDEDGDLYLESIW